MGRRVKSAPAARAFVAACALLAASQALLSLFFRWSAGFPGFRWTPGEAVPTAIPAADFPWATWLAFLSAMAVIPVAWERLAARRKPAEIGFALPQMSGVVLTVGSAAIMVAYTMLWLRASRQSLPHAQTINNALFFSTQWLVTAVGEETLYRGVVQRRLSEASGVIVGTLVTALVWAFWGHLRASVIENLVLRLPIGVLMGCLYSRSRSLYPPIMAHWILNMAAVM